MAKCERMCKNVWCVSEREKFIKKLEHARIMSFAHERAAMQ